MATLTGGTFTMSVPGWADGKDGDTGISIQILNSNGTQVASFDRNGDSSWPIDKNQSYADGLKIITDQTQLSDTLLQNTVVKITKTPKGTTLLPFGSGHDSVTFYLSFVFTFDGGTSTKKSDIVTGGGVEDVIRMTDGGAQTVSRTFFLH